MRFFRVPQYLLVALLFTLSASTSAAQDSIDEKRASYLTIQVPGALGTYPMALNNAMAVTGYYMVSATVAHGFIQDADGALTMFSVRGSMWTEPESINSAGDIAGSFGNAAGVAQGFLRYADGRVVQFSFTNAFGDPPQAFPIAINDFDEIAGNYPYPNVATSGFTRSRTGVMEQLFYGDGSDSPTLVTGLNRSGTVIGIISLGSSDFQSFILHPDGYLNEFNFPVTIPAGYTLTQKDTTAASINAEGIIAGWYDAGFCLNPCGGETSSMMSGGFLRSPQGNFTTFQAPGPIVISPQDEYYAVPSPIVINGNGTVAGSYTDETIAQHGFVRDPLGKVTSFDPPRGRQTTATSINDSGVIAGNFYYDWNADVAVGFLRIPMP